MSCKTQDVHFYDYNIENQTKLTMLGCASYQTPSWCMPLHPVVKEQRDEEKTQYVRRYCKGLNH